MAGGAELEALSHELAREMPDSDVAKAMEEEVAETVTSTSVDADEPRRTSTEVTAARELGVGGRRVRLDGSGARPRLAAPAPALPGQPRCGRGWSPWPTPTPAAASKAQSAYGFEHALRRLARAARARRRRRRQRVRAELRAPRDRGRAAPRRASTSGSRSRPGATSPTPPTIAEAVAGRRGAVGGRLQLPQRAGGRAGPRAGRRPGGIGRVETVDVRLLARLRRAPGRRAVVAVRPRVRRDRCAR